jgi:hypothetical protein
MKTRKEFQRLINEGQYIVADFKYDKDAHIAEYILVKGA